MMTGELQELAAGAGDWLNFYLGQGFALPGAPGERPRVGMAWRFAAAQQAAERGANRALRWRSTSPLRTRAAWRQSDSLKHLKARGMGDPSMVVVMAERVRRIEPW